MAAQLAVENASGTAQVSEIQETVQPELEQHQSIPA